MAVRPLRDKALAFWFQQLQLMTRAGIPLVQSLTLLRPELRQKMQRHRMDQGIFYVKQGRPVADVLGKTGLFPPLACQIIRAGERSGTLDVMFGLLGDFYQKRHEQRQRILQAIAYPAFLMACACVLGVGAVFGIVPVFAEMFAQFSLPLPPLTQALITGVQAIQSQWLGLVITLCGLGLGGAYIYQQPAYRLRLSRYLLQIPWMQRVGLILCWYPFSQLLAIQLASGIPILQAISDAAEAVPFQWFRRDVTQAGQAIAQGASLSQAMSCQRLSNAYVETMLVIGETTGQYEQALQTIQRYYAWQIERAMTMIQQIVGPVVLVLVGAGIGLLIISLLLPLLDLASGMTVTSGVSMKGVLA